LDLRKLSVPAEPGHYPSAEAGRYDHCYFAPVFPAFFFSCSPV
jgi:hypothetical protein